MNNREIDKAIRLAYNFRFIISEAELDDYQRRNPEDLQGDMGRIVYNFLLIKQNPAKQNFNRIYDHLKSTKKKVDASFKSGETDLLRFYLCFIHYYYMKSYAMEDRWLRTMTHAMKTRKLAVALRDRIDDFPDLYFILGDQNYTTSLVPDFLKPLLKVLKFTPDRYGGYEFIRLTIKKADFIRYEASLMYIASSIYVERDYQEAIDLYKQAMEFPEISGYTATEIALETGKLCDIIGNREEAVKAYKVYAKGNGLELHKEEATILQRSPFTENRGSY